MVNLGKILTRFLSDHTIYGSLDEISTPSGERIRGGYILTECGAVTASHDPLNGFVKSEGFPTDENGQSVNDRDYERDLDAQQITRDIAAHYDLYGDMYDQGDNEIGMRVNYVLLKLSVKESSSDEDDNGGN